MMSKEAMQLALDALEGIHPGNMTPMAEEAWNKAITALRQAIKQAEQPAQTDIPDLIAGALGVSRGTAYDLMREALAEQGCDYCNHPQYAGTKCKHCGRVTEQAEQQDYASQSDTDEIVQLGALPEPLRLAAMLEKTMQWPLHGKAADCLRKIHAALEQAEHVKPVAWQRIETAPKDGRKVILFYLNRNTKARTVMARWLTDEEANETDGDGVGLEGGWYECIDNWDDYTEVAIHEGEPSHWMPLPKAPGTHNTAPPPRQPWVGLTDVEWMNIVNKDQAWFGQRPDEVAHEVAKLVEAKLKEKNT